MQVTAGQPFFWDSYLVPGLTERLLLLDVQLLDGLVDLGLVRLHNLLPLDEVRVLLLRLAEHVHGPGVDALLQLLLLFLQLLDSSARLTGICHLIRKKRKKIVRKIALQNGLYLLQALGTRQACLPIQLGYQNTARMTT